MADINDALAANRAAVLDLVAAAERSAATWTTPRAPAHKAMNPASGPATPAEARVRLERALARFDEECRRRVASGQHVVTTGFGTVSVEDFVRFNAMHTRPHCKQMPGAT